MAAPTEKELMLRGELYLASDPELVAARRRARALVRRFNDSRDDDPAARAAIFRELFARVGERVEIEPTFRCDYGRNIELGDDVFINFGCVLLDCNRIRLGNRVLLGPGVHVYAATHPVDPEARRTGRELALPVTIGDNAWIGGGSIICPGVTIGPDSVIGAGSVVTRDIPARVVAVGNPCRVTKAIG